MNPFQKIFEKQKEYFNSDVTKPYEWRIEQLDRLAALLKDNEQALLDAIGSDFKTSLAEKVFEVAAPLGTIEFTKAFLKEWMAPQEATLPKFLRDTGHRGIVYREPYGVTLVMGPFNGPLILLLHPAIAALSAGNTVVLKPSDALGETVALLTKLIPEYFEPEAVAIVTGAKEEITELLKLPFDFIFFTGSTKVGKIVFKAAAENLTPVILELGGLNPAIVDETADIANAARKLVWGATAWGGQWCTSPGYAYVHQSIAEEFVNEAKEALSNMYGPDPKTHPDFSKIISSQGVKRLASLLPKEGVIAGGDYDEAQRYFAPTLIYPVKWTDEIMENEIFGPILPILTYSDFKDAIRQVKKVPKPLAGYIFSSNEENINYFLNSLSFGGGAVNETNIHLYIETMPFGGVGNSGTGHYYGKFGYDNLTHAKSILVSPSGKTIEHLIPPYNMEKIQDLNKWLEY